MRRIDKEFSKKIEIYEKELAKFGWLEDDRENTHKNFYRSTSVDWYNISKTVGGSYILRLDWDVLELLGFVEINMYHDNSFGISKECVPFDVNDLESLQKVIEIFFGSPFDIELEKIRSAEFIRYTITLNEIKAKNFEQLLTYLTILNNCLHKVHGNVEYD